jgi:hypothetical protein
MDSGFRRNDNEEMDPSLRRDDEQGASVEITAQL